MKRDPLRDAIVAGLAAGGGAQQAGGADNSLQPAHGLLRRSGREDEVPPTPAPPATVLAVGTGDPDQGGESVGGALPGETDYLDAHDLVDWEQAPFAATAWAIGRAHPRPGCPEPTPIARWLWVGADGLVTGTHAPAFGVQIHPGRGMTLRRPSADERPRIQRAGLCRP